MSKCNHIIALGFSFLLSSAFADVDLLSKTSLGEQGNGYSGAPVVSADGNVVAFASRAFNLVGDVRYESGIVVHNRNTRISKRIDPDTEIPRGYRNSLSISADGRFVVFAVDLVYIHFTQQVYIHDLQTGITERVDRTITGKPANGWSFRPSIDADGRYVAFESPATNLALGDTNKSYEIFIPFTV